MSIFEKTCPQCTATQSAGAVRCACGYLFNPLYLEDPQLALELAIREEKLIEEYLAARAEQAIEVARTAARAASVEPDDEKKAAEAAKAQQSAAIAQAELAEQCVRTAEAEGRVNAHVAQRALAGRSADTAGVADRGKRSWRSIIVAEALKAASAQIAPRRGAAVVPKTKPGAAFRAGQAAKADKAVAEGKELRTIKCPACGAAVSADATSCRCGWSIPTSLREPAVPRRSKSKEQQRPVAEKPEAIKPNKPR